MSQRNRSLDSNNNDSCTERSLCEERDMKKQLKNLPRSAEISEKRHVQFADLMGRKLASVKVITPASSEEDMFCATNSQPSLTRTTANSNEKRKQTYCFPLFAACDLGEKQNVCLEKVILSWCVIAGTIKVRNLAFAKEVSVRYTTDEWETYKDVWADYVPGSSDGTTERFQFRVTVPRDFKVAGEIEFAIRYRVAGKEFWDNNFERNYRIELSKSLASWLLDSR